MKKIHTTRILLWSVCLLATLVTHAQGGWERNYQLTPITFSNFYRVVLSTDGGYCALAPWDFDTTSIHLLKTDADGAPQWEVALPTGDTMYSTSLYAANDGSYLLTRGTQKIWDNSIPLPKASLLKFSSVGTLVWRKNYYLGQSAAFKSVKTLQNGQIMAVGEVYQNTANHGLILRTDATGTLIDTANISIPLGRVTLRDFFEKSDGTFLVSGKVRGNNSNTTYEFWMHLDNQLNVLETKILDNTDFTTTTRFSSNGTLFVAKINVSLYELFIDKINTAGELLWEKNFANQWGVNIGQSDITIDGSPDGGCVFALGDGTWAIVKLDEDGNQEWFRSLSPLNLDTRRISDIRSTPDNGCIACGDEWIFPNVNGYLVKIGENGLVYDNLISGRIVSDTEQNCTNDPSDKPLSSRVVKATGTSTDFFSITDINGNYTMDVPPGTYLVHSTPSSFGIPAAYCVDSVTVNLPDIGDNVLVDFADTLPRCPLMEVSLGTPVIRPCFSGIYNGYLANMGTDTAFNAYIIVTLDDLLSFTSSTPSATSVVGQSVRIDFNPIPSGQYRNFQIKYFTDCNAPLGYTHCTEAHAYPDSSCLPTNGLWNGASLTTNAVCDGDSVVFKIQNIGTGNMVAPADYIVIEDDMIQRHAETPILAAGETLTFKMAADGSTYRLEVDQQPFHPSLAQLSAVVVQGCNAGVFTTGFVNLFPTPDDDPWIDIDCRENINSYDPNSKEALPLGFGTQHFIEANTALEYTLHFQNTGTAEAITVVLKDTMEATLDLLSIEPGASSHNYTWSVTGRGVLTFRFDDIFLPDSNTNEPASKGFVTFRIRQKPDLALGTVIHNKVAIYFDFNAPIITNSTEHIIGKDFVPVAPPPVVSTTTPQLSQQWQVSPNPAHERVIISHANIPKQFFPLQITVTDMLGRKTDHGTMSGNNYTLQRGSFASGLYFYEIRTEGGVVVGQGKIYFD
jgi:Secretion system C-terminal sorting domain